MPQDAERRGHERRRIGGRRLIVRSIVGYRAVIYSPTRVDPDSNVTIALPIMYVWMAVAPVTI